MSFFSSHSKICFVTWWHNSEWDAPSLLMHAMAVEISEKFLYINPMIIDNSLLKE